MRRLPLILLFLTPCLFGYIRANTAAAPPVFPLVRTDYTGIQFYLNNLIVAGATSSASGSNVTVISANSNPLQAVREAQGAWNNVSTSSVKFLPLQSTSATSDPGGSTNVVSIAASPSELSLVNGVLALTVNSWEVSSAGASLNGNITNSDILLNPDTPFSTDGSTAYDLQAVMTHEFGHSLGANHTGLLGATMFQYNSNTQISYINQRYLSMDDVTFVSDVYPASGGSSLSLGTVSGTITVSGAPVPFALLTLIGTATSAASGLTIGGVSNADGTYSLQVPPGSYLMYAEPFGIVQASNLYLNRDTVPSDVAALAAIPGFQSTFFGGNTSPGTITVTANNMTSGNNIAVTPGATTLASPYVAVIPTGQPFPSNTTISTIGGPLRIASGQTVDLAIVGPGYDATLSTANFLVYGSGITVTKVFVDTSGTFNIGGQVLPLIRATLSIPARQNADVATIFVNKAGNSISYTGVLVITPPTPVFTTSLLENAASYTGAGQVSPGGITSIFPSTGNSLGPTTAVQNSGLDAYGYLPGQLGGVRVTFDGILAPLFYVSSSLINVQVPFEVAGKTSTSVVVDFYGSQSAPVSVPVVKDQPAFFTLAGDGAADSIVANPDYSFNLKSNPAARGSYVTAYGTGVGNVAGLGLVTGLGAPAAQGAAPYEVSANYSCTIGSVVLTYSAATNPNFFIGWTPTAIGLAQFTFQVPTSLPANSTQTLKCTDTVTGASTPTGTLYVGN